MKCADKMSFKTRGEAYDFAKSLRKRGKKSKRCQYSLYECAYCGLWHVSHYKQIRFNDRIAAKHKFNYDDVRER